jgi:hypothetical protein
LRAKINSALRQSVTAHLKDSISSKIITIVTIFIASGNLEYLLSKKFFHGMIDVPGISSVNNTVADAVNQMEPVFYFTQQQKSSITANLVAGKTQFSSFLFNWQKIKF